MAVDADAKPRADIYGLASRFYLFSLQVQPLHIAPALFLQNAFLYYVGGDDHFAAVRKWENVLILRCTDLHPPRARDKESCQTKSKGGLGPTAEETRGRR